MAGALTPLYWAKTTILAKIEEKYGEDAAPGGAAALRIKNADLTPLAASTIDRAFVRPSMGASSKSHVDVRRQIKFGCEFAGSGAAGAPPGYGPILRACALSETVRTAAQGVQASPGTPAVGNVGALTYVTTPYTGRVARTATVTCATAGASGVAKVSIASPATDGAAAIDLHDVTVTDGAPLALGPDASVTPTIVHDLAVGDAWTIQLTPACVIYRPRSEGFESASLYFYRDGHLYKAAGSRGTATFAIKEKDVPLISFDLQGLWEGVTANATPVPSPQGFELGLPVSMVNTPVARLFGVDVVLKTFELNLNNKIVSTDRPNLREVRITDHPISGSISFQYPRLADFDIEGAAHDDMIGAFRLVHGTTGGATVEIAGAQVQITEPKMSDDDGIVSCDATLTFIPSDAGDDDVSIVVR